MMKLGLEGGGGKELTENSINLSLKQAAPGAATSRLPNDFFSFSNPSDSVEGVWTETIAVVSGIINMINTISIFQASVPHRQHF